MLENFFTKIKVRGLSGATIKRCFDAGFDTPFKIANMGITDLDAIVGKKVALKLFDAKQSAVNDADCVTLMDASNSFGRGFGEKRLQSIVEKYPHIQDSKNNVSVDNLMSIQGISSKTAGQFLEGLKSYNIFLASNPFKCKSSIVQSSKNEKKSSVPPHNVSNVSVKQNNMFMKDEVVIFTGFRDKEVEKLITYNGGKVVTTMTGKVTLVITGNSDAKESTKIKKARDNGVPIMTINEFNKKYIV
jgi:DNA ligase (NAD+)